LVLLLLVCTVLQSDTVIMKNGKVYENVKTTTKNDKLEIEQDGQTFTVPKSQVKSIKKKEVVAKKADTNQNTSKRYTDNGNGTVTDNLTGFIWQKCSLGQTGNTCEVEAKEFNWDDANSQCSALTLAKKKWKLPSIDELKTLIRKGGKPTIDTQFFPNTSVGSIPSMSVVSPNHNPTPTLIR
jgi:Protein of unknown function (DUF1566)